MTLMIFWLFPSPPPIGQSFTYPVKYSNSSNWIARKFFAGIQGLKRMNPNDFWDTLTFSLVPKTKTGQSLQTQINKNSAFI